MEFADLDAEQFLVPLASPDSTKKIEGLARRETDAPLISPLNVAESAPAEKKQHRRLLALQAARKGLLVIRRKPTASRRCYSRREPAIVEANRPGCARTQLEPPWTPYRVDRAGAIDYATEPELQQWRPCSERGVFMSDKMSSLDFLAN
jgi:hypothetical protein